MKSVPPIPNAHVNRFWSRVQRSEGCWLWRGAMNNGYGLFRFDRENYPAHRVAAVISGKTVDADDVVLHTCDNRLCVNPTHLVVGTQRDNVRDAVAKGRATGRDYRAEAQWRRKQDDAVAYLDYLHANLCGFAKALNVGPLPFDFETWRKARYGTAA